MVTDVIDATVPRTDARLTDRDEGTHGWAPRWTAAHTETARFLGTCVGAGAVLGMVDALSRARGGQ
jgi:hypothetical protein